VAVEEDEHAVGGGGWREARRRPGAWVRGAAAARIRAQEEEQAAQVPAADLRKVRARGPGLLEARRAALQVGWQRMEFGSGVGWRKNTHG
jgi:hypothetical protein